MTQLSTFERWPHLPFMYPHTGIPEIAVWHALKIAREKNKQKHSEDNKKNSTKGHQLL